nr:hypothetical protein [Candidatus Sigynarchaeota archaeon]
MGKKNKDDDEETSAEDNAEENGFGDDAGDGEGSTGTPEETEAGEEETATPEEPVKPKKKIEDIVLPDGRWKIVIQLNGDVSEKLDLVDLKALSGAYMVIKKKFFDDLINLIPNIKHYAMGRAIESVKGIDTQDWTKNPWILVMAKEMKAKATFWLLFKRASDMSGTLVAVGPEPFASSLMAFFPDDDVESRYEHLKKIMIWLTIEPAKWKNVGAFIPNWL